MTTYHFGASPDLVSVDANTGRPRTDISATFFDAEVNGTQDTTIVDELGAGSGGAAISGGFGRWKFTSTTAAELWLDMGMGVRWLVRARESYGPTGATGAPGPTGAPGAPSTVPGPAGPSGGPVPVGGVDGQVVAKSGGGVVWADGGVTLVDGLVPTSMIPALALTNVVTAASQAAMLALTAAAVQPGDVAVRTDGAGTFILAGADPSVLGNWVLLNAPTDLVLSVNGQVGTVVLGKTDVGLANVDNTTDADKPVSTAQATINAAGALIVEGVNTVAASGAAQTIPAVTASTISRITLTAACTLTFPAAAAGKSFTLVLVQDGTGTRLVTWPATIMKWAGGVAPVLSTGAGKIDYLTFVCADGTNWAGFVAGKDMR